MQLYQYFGSPNSRRVRIYLAEKGMQIPCIEVDIGRGESHTPEYLRMNPMGEVPLLQTDGGAYIAESVAICRYLEALQPEPRLFGTTADEVGSIDMWQRRIELKWFVPLTGYWMHTSPIYVQRLTQIPAWAEQNRHAISDFLIWLDGELAARTFIAGDRYSIADILALTTMDHSNRVVGLAVDPDLKHLARWHRTVSERPSARA